MKRIHILENQLHKLNENSYCAGTDHPYFEDEETGECYSASWDCDYGYPFGYWPIDNGEVDFAIGDEYTTHINPCGKCAEQYISNMLYYDIESEAQEISDAFELFVENFQENNYHYDEENDLWVSADGDEKKISDFAREIDKNVYTCVINPTRCINEFVESYINGNTTPHYRS